MFIQTHKNCPLGKWSPFSQCTAKCGLGEKVKVRIPTTHQKRDENLQKITKLYLKLTSKNNRYENDDDDEQNLSDLDVEQISDSDHPCFEMELIERVQCGMKNKPCENDIYEMPRMYSLCSLQPFRFEFQTFYFHL